MGLKIKGAELMIDGFVANTIHVGLGTDATTEVSGGGYARQSVASGSTGWTITSESSNSIRQAANKAKITFPTTTGSWGDVTNIFLYNHATNTGAAALLAEFSLSNNPDAITQSGTVVEIAIGALKIQQPLT